MTHETQQPAEFTLEELEAQGDHAADYIEEFLDRADLDGDLDLEVKNNRAYVSINGGGADLDRLATPEIVQALQELTRLAVQRKTGDFSGLILDIAGSREAREAELHKLADHAMAQVAAGKSEVRMDPLSSYERKLVHDYVAERGYHSESHGERRERRLIISAAN